MTDETVTEEKRGPGRPPKAALVGDMAPIVVSLMDKIALLEARLTAKEETQEDREERALKSFKDVPYYVAPKRPSVDNLPSGFVKVRVLEDGDDRVHTGEYDHKQGKWTRYRHNDVFAMPEADAIISTRGTDEEGNKRPRLLEIVR